MNEAGPGSWLGGEEPRLQRQELMERGGKKERIGSRESTTPKSELALVPMLLPSSEVLNMETEDYTDFATQCPLKSWLCHLLLI